MSYSKQEIIELRFNRIVVFFYYLLIISLPVSIALFESISGFVILFFVLKKILICVEDGKGKSFDRVCRLVLASFYPKEQYLNKPVGLYILAVFMSVVFSQYPAVSIVAFIAKLLEGYFLYFSFVDCVKTKRHLIGCVSVFVLTVSVMVLDGVFQYLFKVDFLRQLPLVDHRVSATLRHANDFGAYLIMFTPMVFGLMTLSMRKGYVLIKEGGLGSLGNVLFSKAALVMTFVLMLVCLGLTFSRGSWVSFWFSMVIFVVILRKYFVPVLLVSLVFLAIFLPFLVKYRDVSFTTDGVNFQREYGAIDPTPENLNKLSPLEQERVKLAHKGQLGMGRFGFWENAINIIKKYPVFGSGFNTYAKQAAYYAHNCYLQMTAETGIAGLIAFLILIGALFRRSLREYVSLNDPFLKTVMAGALAGFAGFLCQSFFDTTLYSVQLGNLMWIIVGLLVTVPRVAQNVE